MKIAHLGDIHTRILKRHIQYKIIFEELYKKLNELKPDIIVVCGDVNHNKINISPESVELISELFRKLHYVAPLYIIPGNHDLMVRNLARQDSLSPVVNALNLPDINYLKLSQEVELGDNFILNHLSIADKERWAKPSNKNKINIALYHGPIVGSVTDSGWIVDRGDLDLNYLSNFDYAFLGDIHKSNQILDSKGKIRYCGSLISQDFSEDNNKGFLLWDIKDKENFTCEFVTLNNPNPFVTIELKDGKIPNELNIKDGSFVRLVSNENLTYDIVNKAIDIVKIKYKPESVIFLNKSLNTKGDISDDLVQEYQQENFRDIVVQEKLIREYFKDFNVIEDTIKKVLELNNKYNVVIEQDEGEIIRNVNWKLKKVEWSNLFNFGENNKIDFSQLNGVVGLFGKSFSGKSSVIDSILYTIFNSITKNSRKNYNIINQNKNRGSGEVKIEIGDDTFIIERISEKYDRRLHGRESEEAKTTAQFKKINSMGIEENLNGAERNDTDKNIRRIFGSIDDFLLTSMSSQFGAMSFINEGSTKRKEILAKFLDLEIFEKKYKMAKEDVTSLKGAIKKAGSVSEYEKMMENIKRELIDIKISLSDQKDKCNDIKKEKEVLENELQVLVRKIEDVPTEMIDIKEVEIQFEKIEKEIEKRNKDYVIMKEELEEKESLLKKFRKFEKEIFDIEEYKKKQKEIDNKREELQDLSKDLQSKEKEIKLYEKKTQLLKEVPCGDEYKHCKFISDAFQSLDIIKEIRENVEKIGITINDTQKQIDDLNPQNIDEYIKKYEKIIEKKNSLLIEIPNLQAKINKEESELLRIERKEEDLKEQKQLYEKNKDVIENLEKLLQEKKEKEDKIKNALNALDDCENDISKLHRKHGSIEQQLETTRENKNQLIQMREEYVAYDLYLKCCHSDGIPFEIIKRRLPFINSEISKALSSVVNFTVYFENNEDKLNLFIKHQNFDPRPLEMGSGAEKVLSSLAIRLALTKITNLPRSNFLVLDEPCLALDGNILESFSRLLEVLKENFEIVILISHLDVLKDMADSEIILTTKDKYASVCQ